MKILSGTFQIAETRWFSTSHETIVQTQNGITQELFGNIQLLNHHDLDMLLDMFRKYGNRLTEHLNGNYLLLFHDEEKENVMIFHDQMTSPINLYYTVKDNVVFYASSLKILLASCDIRRELNEDAIEEYLVNGYIYGEATLLRNVFKLKPMHALQIDASGVNQIEVSYPKENLRAGEALDRWHDVLVSAVEMRCQDLDEISLPISSGYAGMIPTISFMLRIVKVNLFMLSVLAVSSVRMKCHW